MSFKVQTLNAETKCFFYLLARVKEQNILINIIFHFLRCKKKFRADQSSKQL
jgi:hypothetical protein